jgi:O-antigen/teichoic acid export membrane protein
LALPLTLAAALAQAQEFCRRALYTRSQMPAAIANNAVSYVLQALLLGVVGWRLGLDLDQALWIVALTSLLAVLLGYVQLRRFATTERDSLLEVARQSFRIGKWAAASATLATVTVQAFPIIITALAGLPTTAQFGVIRQVLGPLHLLLHPLESYYLPRAARGLDRAGTPGLGRVLRQASFVMAPPFLIYSAVVAIAPGFLLRAVYGDKYIAVADVLRLFALVTMTSLPIAILSLEVGARRLQRYLFVAEGWAAAAIYGVGLYLIAQLGLVGVAITTALAASGQIALFAAVIGRARGAATQAGRSGV